MENKQVETAWAWLCDFGLCKWAEPTRQQLIETGKPSPEAKPVRVQIKLARGPLTDDEIDGAIKDLQAAIGMVGMAKDDEVKGRMKNSVAHLVSLARRASQGGHAKNCKCCDDDTMPPGPENEACFGKRHPYRDPRCSTESMPKPEPNELDEDHKRDLSGRDEDS